MRKSVRIAGISLLAAATLASTGYATAQAAAPAKTVTVVKTVQAPPKIVYKDKIKVSTRVVYKDRTRVVYRDRIVYEDTALAGPRFTNSVAVVTQFYQYITDRNYPAAWKMGGKYIGGRAYPTYPIWAAAYSTTASVTLYSQADWGSGRVHASLSALQDDGTTRTYAGTYTVKNGVIVSAHIVRTS